MKELCPAEALHEECGVFGIYDSTGKTNMVSAVYSALYALQHRGQESCGIALNVDGVLTGYRDLGLVSEVFTPRVLADLPQDAKMATGHVRYATSGQRTRANAQPMVLHHCKGTMAICHNGNLTNAPQLRHKLEMNGSIFHGTSDTEVIGYLLTQNRLISPDIETAVCRTMEQIVGAYSLVIMTHTKLIAARDPNGFRPLCIGQLPDGSGWAFASESCALDAVGARFVRDVLPGEIVVADYTGLRTIRTHCGTAPHTMCVFEYIYFARPDSIIEGTCVHDARLQAGRFLAQEHPVEADVVIGAPDSGLDAALGYAQESGIPYGVGARTIKLLRDAGAKEVHYRISAPPFAHPCYFGTDIPDEKDLIATGHTVEEIRQIVGADSLGYLSIEHVTQLAIHSKCGFCTGCFTGHYPVPAPNETMDIVYDKPLSQSQTKKRL